MRAAKGEQRIVDIACRIRRQTDKAIAIAVGEIEEVVDRETGELVEREKLTWLPKSQVQINEDRTISVPEWLLIEKGLEAFV